MLLEPDDQGIPLDELGQAYAALLKKGTDPYPEAPAAEPEEPEAVLESEVEPLPDDEPSFEVTPASILEAILFVGHPAGEPLTSQQIAGLMRGVPPGEIDDLVVELNATYARENAPYTIEPVGAGYRLRLRPEFAALQNAFYGRIREARLSQAAIDVLAIVAYNQPLTAERIEELRGKPSGAILAQLVRRDLLELRRTGEKQRKAEYFTTDRFLALFGLQSLAELPRSQDVERDL